MSLLLDAGALIAYERGSRPVRAYLERAHRDATPVRTTTAVVAQVWRRPSVQVALSRYLRGIDEVELGRTAARRIGELLARARRVDVVDGSLIDAARDGDEILTSDPSDLLELAQSANKSLLITRV